MDERSPRQPDSSGPPEESDEAPARGARPANPYRIPQRPPGAPPAGSGGFGGRGPGEPSAPSGTPHAADPGAYSDEGNPYRGKGASPPETPEASTRPEGDARTPWDSPVDEPSEGPRRASRGAEVPSPARWEASEDEETPGDSRSGTSEGWRSSESWRTPVTEEPSTSWSDSPGTPSPPPERSEERRSWEALSTSASDRPEHWDTPYPSVQGPSGTWDEPSQGGFQDPVSVHDSWQEAPRDGAAPSGPSEAGRGDTADHGDSWEDEPYRNEPVYHGDTPYPGGAPLSQEGHDLHTASGHPREQRPGAGFEYLYGDDTATDDHDGPEYPDEGHHAPAPPPPRRSRRGLLIGVVSAVVVLLLVGGAASWYVLTLPQPEETTAEYEAAWEAQDYERLAAVTTGGDAAAVLSGIDAGLGVESIDVEIDAPSTEGGSGHASYEVTVGLANAGDWGWEGELPLVREDGRWWVRFSPEVAYPGLGEGQVLARTAVWGERGKILASDGTRLDTPDISGSLQMIVGSLGEATEEDLERLGPAYSVGDTVGMDGLQRTYEERLAGEAATTIVMVDAADAEDTASLEVTEENTVAALDGSDGEDIVTSIDMSVQNAAANAIIGSEDPAGMVAVRPSTGEILAAVNVPGGFNRAFEGQYPPGSAFKIVSYSSLLDSGMTMDTTMECPKEYDLGGWPFRNAGGAEYGSQTVVEAFATSCNTSLVAEVGERLGSDTLQAGAEQFGMNAPLDIGVPTFEPTFPPVDSSTMLGAQSIGQGQVLTSPLHMATVPAAVADGSWRHPVLVTEPAQESLPESRQIAHAESLRTMMRAVITDGTAKDLPFQGEVHGKTGTAEYGTAEDADEDDELPSHAWMVGYKGDVAFAVVVEGGGGGSAVAGPLAVEFTNAL